MLSNIRDSRIQNSPIISIGSRKLFYGLKQAPRAWYERLTTYLLEKKFERGEIDRTLFINGSKDELLVT